MTTFEKDLTMSKVDPALIQRNREVMKSVAPLFDELNKAWEKVELFMRKQGILREVTHFVYHLEDANEQPYAEACLTLKKWKGEWRICYEVSLYNDPTGKVECVPVLDCSTELRVELLDYVAGLFAKLVESNEAYVPELEQAVAKSHSVLESLGLPMSK
jgi:hypothetical protein